MSFAADAQRGTTYANFTADRVFYAPTDLVSIAGRILAFNASDQATAFNLGKGFNVSAYNPGGDAKTPTTDKTLLMLPAGQIMLGCAMTIPMQIEKMIVQIFHSAR